MKNFLILLFAAFPIAGCLAQTKGKTENLIVITIDGCRWNEVFQGADSIILYNEKFKKSYTGNLTRKFWAKTPLERRQKLMPFLWTTIAQQGRIYGNRLYGNNVSVKNPYNVSYPGYSEIFTGYPDPAIKTNEPLENPNTNVFEFINKQPGFKGKVASFASWNRAPMYLNEKRSKLMVNGGYAAVTGKSLSPLQQTLNNLQAQYDKGDHSRADYITYLHAKEYLRLNTPRVMSIGLAWTDDAAHDGSYPLFLENIFSFDGMIADLWHYLQSHPQYKNKTTLLITVDHGRGYGEQWVSHGPNIAHSNEMWFAIMGPDISPMGEMKTKADLYQNQFAQTMANLLGLEFKSDKEIGEAIKELK